MRINHNIASMNTYRQLTVNNSALAKSTEKLSSGLRINRAGDDAAGLAISEKMRGQIRGLDQAQRNAQDGISYIQTAEGALNETHSILQRMRELAVQSASGSNTDTDRAAIQDEIKQLKSEVDRIASTTEFNTMKLLDGSKGTTAAVSGTDTHKLGGTTIADASLTADTYQLKSVAAGTLSATVGTSTTGITSSAAFDFTDTTKIAGLDLGEYTLEFKGSSATSMDIYLKDKNGVTILSATGQDISSGAASDVTLSSGSLKFTVKKEAAAGQYSEGTTKFTLEGNFAANKLTVTGNSGSGATLYSNSSALKLTSSDLDANGLRLHLTTDAILAAAGSTTNIKVTNNSAEFQIGANQTQTMKVGIQAMDTKALGIDKIDLSTQTGAQAAITAINNAIEKVSTQRSALGAYQNRLEHTINNLGTSSENLTAAESRIRDVDMAKEMMEQTRSNILAQAAQAMLAQANQQPQGVLQLLR